MTIKKAFRKGIVDGATARLCVKAGLNPLAWVRPPNPNKVCLALHVWEWAFIFALLTGFGKGWRDG